jgi:hypothetical protein
VIEPGRCTNQPLNYLMKGERLRVVAAALGR